MTTKEDRLLLHVDTLPHGVAQGALLWKVQGQCRQSDVNLRWLVLCRFDVNDTCR